MKHVSYTPCWTSDRLNKYANADYSFDEVQALLDEAHVECARLDGSRGEYADFKRRLTDETRPR